MKCRWQEGNRITLLENGDQYYPALFAAIGRASRRVILESFIWFEDEVGRRLHAVLLEAAVRNTILQLRGIDSMQDFMDRQQRMMLDDDA